MLKTTYYDSSVDKWKKAIQDLRRSSPWTLPLDGNEWFNLYCRSTCGFCRMFQPKSLACGECPLYPKSCCYERKENALATFWKIQVAAYTNDLEECRRLSRLMLRSIRRHWKKFL